MFIFDAHLDLAMNALEWNRDLTKSVYQIRESEKGMVDKPDRGNNTVSLDAMRKGNIGICVATQIAGIKNKINPHGWSSMEQAWAQTQGQLNWYKEMEKNGEIGFEGSKTQRHMIQNDKISTNNISKRKSSHTGQKRENEMKKLKNNGA